MTHRFPLRALSLFLPAALTIAACSGTAASTTSTVIGTIDQSSFPSKVTQLTVEHTDGSRTTAAVDVSGRFSLDLHSGSRYRVFLGDAADIPLVVRSGSVPLGALVDVRSAGAQVDLGSIRYWPGATQTFSSRSVQPSSPSSDVCAGGVMSASGQPCAVQGAQIACVGDGDGETNDDGEEGRSGDGDGEHADDGFDCQDGLDTQGNICDGGPSANQNDGETNDDAEAADDTLSDDVDASLPMAVASVNLEAPLRCAGNDEGDGDGEENDD